MKRLIEYRWSSTDLLNLKTAFVQGVIKRALEQRIDLKKTKEC